jgi:hypothetical protein
MLLIRQDDTRRFAQASPYRGFLGVGAHDQVDVAGPQLEGGEGFGDVVRLVDREVDASRPTVLVGVLLMASPTVGS